MNRGRFAHVQPTAECGNTLLTVHFPFSFSSTSIDIMTLQNFLPQVSKTYDKSNEHYFGVHTFNSRTDLSAAREPRICWHCARTRWTITDLWSRITSPKGGGHRSCVVINQVVRWTLTRSNIRDKNHRVLSSMSSESCGVTWLDCVTADKDLVTKLCVNIWNHQKFADEFVDYDVSEMWRNDAKRLNETT